MRLRTAITSVACVAALATPAANALAVARNARQAPSAKNVVIVNTSVEGPVVQACAFRPGTCRDIGNPGGWGSVQVELSIRQVEDVVGEVKKLVSVKITDVSWPVFPNATPRSVYIDVWALPQLRLETLRLQMNSGTRLSNITGASDTTAGWRKSLQAALLLAEQPH